MGNQGMTNWKFSAFFAIALMLIAGLFSTPLWQQMAMER